MACAFADVLQFLRGMVQQVAPCLGLHVQRCLSYRPLQVFVSTSEDLC